MISSMTTVIESLKAAGLSEAQIAVALKALTSKGGGRTTPKPCKCGCGGTTKGGVWLPGHDAKHLSKVLAATRAALTAPVAPEVPLAPTGVIEDDMDPDYQAMIDEEEALARG